MHRPLFQRLDLIAVGFTTEAPRMLFINPLNSRWAIALALLLVAMLVEPLRPPSPVAAQAATDEASPSTLYVRPDGNDGTNGQTVANAWRTLGHALRSVQPGQTVFVMNGTYTQARCSWCGAHFRLAPGDRGVSASADAPIRVVNFPGHRPEIFADRGTGIEVVGSYLEVSGFRIRGEGFSATNNYGYGIMYEAGRYITMNDNIISGFPLNGIGGNNSSGVTIARNIVFNNAWWSPNAGSGISHHVPKNMSVPPGPDGYQDRIVDNISFGNENRVATPAFAPAGMVSDGNGIIVDETNVTGYTGRILVMNNIVANNGGKGINIYNSSNVDVIHNTLYRNGFTTNMYGSNGDFAVNRSTNIRILNNIVEARADRTAFLTLSSPVVRGNVFSGGLSITSVVSRTDNLVTAASAGFTSPSLDPRNGDFRLTSTSPGLDRGVVMTMPILTDLAAAQRPVGGYDAGAYERQLNVSAPVTTSPPSTTTTAPPTTIPATTAPTVSPTTVASSTVPPMTAPVTTAAPTTTAPTVATPGTGTQTEVVVRARGTVGDEAMVLMVNGRAAASWTVGKSFVDHRVTLDQAVAVNQVQIRFTNDSNAGGVDRNLEVDWVRVGANTHHAEDALVQSIGTWIGGTCGTQGNHRSQWLHCNGHFDFAAVAAPAPTPVPQSAQVVVRARGSVGDETMNLTVNGSVVQTWKVTRTLSDYVATVPASVSIDQIRVHFNNDLYQPPIDRNLEVDFVRVGSQTYQTEDPKVAGIGPWTGSSCGVLGNHRTQWLNCNGYFDFRALGN